MPDAYLQAMLDYLADHGGYARISGVLRVGFPQVPKDPTGVAALYLPVAKSLHPTVLDFSGAVINYVGAPDTYLLRVYQSGNNASWRGLELRGGYFNGSGTVDPAGCLLWDDLGNSRSHGCQFNGWTRTAGNENAYAIHQRNYDTWSENNTHESHAFTNCDTWIYTSLAPDGGWSSSMARTRIENIFGSNCKAYAIINTAGMYDSVIRNIKGNGQRIATILNTGGAVINSHLEEIKTEQGRSLTVRTSGSMAGGDTTLTLASETGCASWMAQGQPVTVSGAGAGGTLLETWITGYTSASEVTLHHAAAADVIGATVTLAATACYEDRSTLHQFAYSKMFNRDGGVLRNAARFTGGDASQRETNFGAISAGGTVTGAHFRSLRTGYADQVVLNSAGHYLYPVHSFGKTLANATATELLGTADTQLASNACWRVTVYGTDGQFFGECLTFRRQGTNITGRLTIAETNMTFSLSSGALMATQTTGNSVSARVVIQRMA